MNYINSIKLNTAELLVLGIHEQVEKRSNCNKLSFKGKKLSLLIVASTTTILIKFIGTILKITLIIEHDFD